MSCAVVRVVGRWLLALTLTSPSLASLLDTFLQLSDAEQLTVTLRAGDVVLLATDGVFDNLFTAEIEEHVNNDRQLRVLSRVACGEDVKVSGNCRFTHYRAATHFFGRKELAHCR